MNLKIPKKNPEELIIYIWKIIDLPKISKKDLLYNISFKFFLISPSSTLKLIEKSIQKGYLTQNPDKTISLSDQLSRRLNSWQQSRKNKIKKQEQLREKQASDLKKLTQSKSSDFTTLLKAFSDKATRGRAVTVSDGSFNFVNLDLEEGKVEAEVAGSKKEPYVIGIDSDKKVLKHDCHDFRERRAPDKKFCKHLVKLFFLLNEQKGEHITGELLNKIADSINEWEFTN